MGFWVCGQRGVKTLQSVGVRFCPDCFFPCPHEAPPGMASFMNVFGNIVENAAGAAGEPGSPVRVPAEVTWAPSYQPPRS